MQKREAKFDTEFQKWLKYNYSYVITKLGSQSMQIETKVVLKDKPFNFKSGFKPHQLPTLINIRSGVFIHKWSDIGRITQPFDISFNYKTQSWVVIKWEDSKIFYFIDPTIIQSMIDNGKKSIYEYEVIKCASLFGELGVIHDANISQT